MIKKLFIFAFAIVASLSSAHAETACYSVKYHMNGRMQTVDMVTSSENHHNEIIKYVISQNLRNVNVDGDAFKRSMENIVIQPEDCHYGVGRQHVTYSSRYRT